MKTSCAFLFVSAVVLGQSPIYYADAIVPQMPVGCAWNATLILVNLTTSAVTFTVNFWPSTPSTDATGMPVGRMVPIQGLGLVSSVTGSVPTNGSYTIVSNEPGVATANCNGWAEVISTQALGGYEVLTQHYTVGTQDGIGGIQLSQTTTFTFQTTVPFSSRFANKFTVPFDTTSFTPAIALVNPSFQLSANVTITYLDNNGNMICQEPRTLLPGEQQAFVLYPPYVTDTLVCAQSGDTNSYGLLKGKAGVAQFSTSNLELSGFGLGFGALGFVSFPGQTPIGQ
jgi:hypothetical protein